MASTPARRSASSPARAAAPAPANGEPGGSSKRDDLIEAAVELFAANGYAGTSIRDIAKITGRSGSNGYHYFKDKDALWLAILEYSVRGMPVRLRAAMEGADTAVDRFVRLVRAHLDESVRHRCEAKIFFIDEERLSPAGKRINKQIQKDIFDLYLQELRQLATQLPVREGNLRVRPSTCWASSTGTCAGRTGLPGSPSSRPTRRSSISC
jgi:AcrR family transcriptional regulator